MASEPSINSARGNIPRKDSGYSAVVINGLRVTQYKGRDERNGIISYRVGVTDGSESMDCYARTKDGSRTIAAGQYITLTSAEVKQGRNGEYLTGWLGDPSREPQQRQQPQAARPLSDEAIWRQQRGFCVDGILKSPWMTVGQWDSGTICATADTLAKYVMTGELPAEEPDGYEMDPNEVPEY